MSDKQARHDEKRPSPTGGASTDRERMDWARLIARQSRIVALLTFAGGIIVILSLYWSYAHLRASAIQLQANQVEIELKEEKARELDGQIHSLELQRQAYATLLNGVGPDALRKTIEKNPSAAALVPVVYIRTANKLQQTTAGDIASALRADGFVVSSIEDAGSGAPPTGNQLRYYHSEDGESPELKRILGALQGMGIQASPQFIEVVEGTGRPRRKHYEFWFAADYVPPLRLMSNDELKGAIADFQRRMQVKYGGFYDLEDLAARARGNMVEGSGNRVLDQQAIERYNEMVNSIQTEIPQANLFIAEVTRRLGSQAWIEPPIPTAPAQTVAGLFVGKMRFFEERANKLP